MKFLVRTAFLGLMALAVRGELHWGALAQPDATPLLLLESRVAALGLQNVKPIPPDVDVVAAAGCAAPVLLGLFTADGDESPRIAPLLTPDVTPLYIYVGAVADTRAALHPVRRWLAANAMAMLGAREARAPSRFVLALLPKACPGLAALDWMKLSP